MNIKNKIPDKIKAMMQQLLDRGFECFIIGGFCRDSLLEIEPHDHDLFTNASGEDILRIFPEGVILGGVERGERILTVIVDGVEISQFRKSGDRTETGTDFETHIKTCDFTCNALAIDINGNIIDLVNGEKDIRMKLLRCVGNPEKRFKEDYLRILRAIRFQSKYNFELEWDTSCSMTNLCHNLVTLPAERLREEFIKIIQYENGIENLSFCGLIQIIPELYHENHFKSGGQHHDETPFEHMCEAFKQSCKITTDYRIKLAVLLHDIGKGETREELEEETHFYDHDNIGAEITEKILKRLKFSNDDITFITTLVKKHMFGYIEDIQDKTYVKFYAELESKKISIYDYLMVVYCDRQANLKKPRDSFGDFCKMSNEKYLLYHYNRIKSKHYPFSIKDLEISGRDLINIGMKPGPLIGKTLKSIYNNVLEGELKNSREELMYYIKTGK